MTVDPWKLIESIRRDELFHDQFYLDQVPKLGAANAHPELTLIEHYIRLGINRGLPGHPNPNTARQLHQLVSAALNAASPPEASAPVKAIAFYLPQFHPIPENDLWWGKGFTEWTNVAQARPRFAGHDQPRIPGELGFYDLRLPEARDKQAEMAREYGVHGFCYYYYWFAGRRLLERPLDEMLHSGAPDFPFCLCWANENWTRRWDGGEHDILISQEHTPENDLAFSESLLPYFRDPRYIRVGGRPMLLVYRPDVLPDLKGTVERWRGFFRSHGVGEVYLVAGLTFGFHTGVEVGFDAEVQFPPHSVHLENRVSDYQVDPEFVGKILRYPEMAERYYRPVAPGKTRFFTAMLGWDNTARKKNAGHVFEEFTLEGYEAWMRYNVAKTRELYSDDEQFVFINAWNEWGEGTYLEPDRKHGMGYLEATRRALSGLEGMTLEQVVELFGIFTPTDADAAASRIERLVALAPRDSPLPDSVTSLLAPVRDIKISAIEYEMGPDTRCWIETAKTGDSVSETGLELGGWTISRQSPPKAVEFIVGDESLVQMEIVSTRFDVYDYHKGFTEQRGPNAFFDAISRDAILARVKLGAAPMVKVRVVSADALELSIVKIHLEVQAKASRLAELASRHGGRARAAARAFGDIYLQHAPVLFVMHDLYPAGAQLFLARFLTWLRATTPALPFEVLVTLRHSELATYGDRAAALAAELEGMGPVHWLDEDSGLPTNAVGIESGRYSLIYINSVASLRNAYVPRMLGRSALLHVHELDFSVSRLLSPRQIEALRASETEYVACSQAVSDMLGRLGVEASKTHTLYPFVPPSAPTSAPKSRKLVRDGLDIPENATVILLVGSVNWRKGAYLLSSVAQALKNLCPEAQYPYFVWVGEIGDEEIVPRLRHEFQLLNLGRWLRFAGRHDDVAPFYAAADIFLLTSIEDPFPLVMMEAGGAGLPVVAFEMTGGAAEFIAADQGGLAVPVLDTGAMAAALHLLATHPRLRAEVGEHARASARRFSLEVSAPKLRELICSRREAFAAYVAGVEA